MRLNDERFSICLSTKRTQISKTINIIIYIVDYKLLPKL